MTRRDQEAASTDRVRIQCLDRSALSDLWRRILDGRDDDWPAGRALEYLVIRAFEIDGADVRWPYSVHLAGSEVEQIDGAVYCGALACLVETKDRGPLNVEPVAKLRNQLLRRPAPAIGAVFTSEGFTSAARLLASYLAPQTILLWDRGDIDWAFTRGSFVDGLTRKYRFAVEEGIADYNLTEREVES